MTKDFQSKNITDWDIVQDCLNEETASGYKMALIEANKLLGTALEKAGYPGKDIDERIKSAKEKFANPTGLLKARERCGQILNSNDYNLNSIDVEESVQAFHQALVDIQVNPEGELSFFDRIMASINYYIPAKGKFLRKIVLWFVGFFIVVKILADTSFGQGITGFILGIVRFVFDWILAIIFLLIGIAVVVIGSLIYFEKRRQGNE